MKDSGTPWIGSVPQDWSVLPIKRSVSLKKDRRNDYPATSLYVGLEDVESLTGKYSPTEGSSRLGEDSMVGLFEDGDVLYGKLRPYLRKSIAAKFSGACSTEFLVMKPLKVLPMWLNHWLLTTEVTQQIEASCEGAKMPRADWESISSIPMPVPTLCDQQTILSEIDLATTRIDTLVAKKKRFIELLREKRQALITHAVTKGLDAGVPMKDSGVEWLGDVPAHWALRKVKHIADTDNSGCYGNDEPSVSSPIATKTCTTAHISVDGKFLFDLMEVRYFSPSEVRRYAGKPGDLFVVKSSGSNTNIISGKLARIKDDHAEIVFTNFLMRIRPRQDTVTPEFLEYFLASTITRRRIERMVATTTYPNINVNEYVAAFVPLPPMEEQREILDCLSVKASRIDALIAKTERSIELLREHRTALITAAVTGKIDLRPAA